MGTRCKTGHSRSVSTYISLIDFKLGSTLLLLTLFEPLPLVWSLLLCRLSAQGQSWFIAHMGRVHMWEIANIPVLTVRMGQGELLIRWSGRFSFFLFQSFYSPPNNENAWAMDERAQSLSFQESDTWSRWLSITQSISSGTGRTQRLDIDSESTLRGATVISCITRHALQSICKMYHPLHFKHPLLLWSNMH